MNLWLGFKPVFSPIFRVRNPSSISLLQLLSHNFSCEKSFFYCLASHIPAQIEDNDFIYQKFQDYKTQIQYCQHMLDPDIPSTVLQFLLLDEQDGKDLDLQKINREQAELARANFSILRKEVQSLLDLVIKDATHGSELGKTMSLYVLDAIICVDHDKYQQSRGFLR